MKNKQYVLDGKKSLAFFDNFTNEGIKYLGVPLLSKHTQITVTPFISLDVTSDRLSERQYYYVQIVKRGIIEDEFSCKYTNIKQMLKNRQYDMYAFKWTVAKRIPQTELFKSVSDMMISNKQYIYFVQCQVTKYIKIGYTNNWYHAVRQLQQQSTPIEVLYTCDGTLDLEKDLHKRFDKHRIHHKWFTPHSEILQHIEHRKAGLI